MVTPMHKHTASVPLLTGCPGLSFGPLCRTNGTKPPKSRVPLIANAPKICTPADRLLRASSAVNCLASTAF